MSNVEEEKSARVLDPVERVSEVIFGLLMAMTFIGSINAATAGTRGGAHDDAHRARVQPRLGTCRRGDVRRAHGDRTHPQSHAARAPARRNGRGGGAGARGRRTAAGSCCRCRHRGSRNPAHGVWSRLRLCRRGATSTSTFSRARSAFSFWSCLRRFLSWCHSCCSIRPTLAVRVSNRVALGMLFLAGGMLARYAGGNVWLSGAAMALTGAVLMAAIMALGG